MTAGGGRIFYLKALSYPSGNLRLSLVNGYHMIWFGEGVVNGTGGPRTVVPAFSLRYGMCKLHQCFLLFQSCHYVE